ncbi:MAG: ABC transporter permease [Muribaculaceae bacterium]|nr:ABC transporter permease [Muribaculaceae bacterium]
MKRDTIIKILSLALGLTIGVILIAKIFFELSVNTQVKDYDRIYLIQSTYDRGENPTQFGQISGGVTTGFKNEIPGVESATKFTSIFSNPRYKDENGNIWVYHYPQSILADTCFFDIFDTQIYYGNPKEILNQRDKIMISRSFAEKLGGIEESEGIILTNEDYPEAPMTIAGVYEDYPKNNTLIPDILVPMALMPEASTENWVGNDRYIGYVKLRKGVDPSSLNESIVKMQRNHKQIDEYEKWGMNVSYSLGNIHKIYVDSSDFKNSVIILSIIAILLISISLFNYILIVVSNIVKRSKEVGIMKCYGADKKSILGLLSKESIFQIFVSLLLAFILIFLCQNLIKEYTGYEFKDLLVSQSILAIIIVIALVFTISVFVPGKVYNSVTIDKALRGYSKSSRKWKIGLLGLQVAINIFIICFVLIVTLQYNKITKFNPGYTTDKILDINFYSKNYDDYKRIIEELKKLPYVENIGLSSTIPVGGQSGNNVTFPGRDEEDSFNISDMYFGTPEVFDIFDIKFIEGKIPANPQEVAVSKSFADKMKSMTGIRGSLIGQNFMVTDRYNPTLTISGVYDDFLLGSLLYSDDRPSIWEFGSLDPKQYYFYNILIKVNEITPEILDTIKTKAESRLDEKNLDVMVLSEMVRGNYRESLKIRNIFIIGGSFSILIAMMGLIGFLNDEAQRRRKELAIRKINGASSKDLFSLFYSSIIKLSLASAVVACCGAFIMGRHWLQQFSEKISLSPLIFICGTLFIILIVTVVVIFNSYKVITANPTTSLYNE